MKKILVFSDSHGSISFMEKMTERIKPDRIIHLGDCTEDADELRSLFNDIPMISLSGNCDPLSLRSASFSGLLEGKRFFACHGHRFRVKYDLLALSYAAAEANAEICLFGHTHVPFAATENGILFLNPGSSGAYRSSCLCLQLDSGQVSYEFIKE